MGFEGREGVVVLLWLARGVVGEEGRGEVYYVSTEDRPEVGDGS